MKSCVYGVACMSLVQYFKNRTLRVDILTIFLALISSSFLLIIGYTYARNLTAILQSSNEDIERASTLIVERVIELVKTSENLADEASSLILKPDDFSFEDQRLISYLLKVVKDHPNLYAIYYGIPDGSLLEVVNLAAAYQTQYISRPTEPLPPESAYVLRFIGNSNPGNRDIWYYKDANLKTIASESLPNSTSTPTNRPWYLGAIEAKGIYWSPVYTFDPLGEPGITVSKPVYDSDGKLISIIGVDISLNLFSHFLTEQVVGNSGNAFILNTQGDVIIPEEIPATGINKEIISRAYQNYSVNKKQFFIFDYLKIKYLSSAYVFPVTGSFDWIVLIIAPLNDFIGGLLKTQRDVVLISILILALASLLVIYFSKRISGPIVLLSNQTDKIRHLNFEGEITIDSNIREIKLMESSISALRVAVQSFSRYIPKEIVSQLIEKGQEISIGGEKRNTTVFFTDIEGFTSIAESYDTEQLMALLSEYFGALTQIIMKNEGNIDKFVGDGIMAIWGAPREVANQELQACKAALECQRYLLEANARLKSEGKPTFTTRIGIDTGEVIAGNVGTPERMNYTVMGNIVNTAARLQGINKTYHTRVAISERVHEKIGSKLLTRPLDIVELRGKKEKAKIYELMEGSDPAQVELSSLFTSAFDLFENEQFDQAKAQFLSIQKKFPEDFPTQIFLDRLK